MARLANISGKEAVKAFEKVGRIVMGELSVGTLRSLIRNAGLKVEDFLELI